MVGNYYRRISRKGNKVKNKIKSWEREKESCKERKMDLQECVEQQVKRKNYLTGGRRLKNIKTGD